MPDINGRDSEEAYEISNLEKNSGDRGIKEQIVRLSDKNSFRHIFFFYLEANMSIEESERKLIAYIEASRHARAVLSQYRAIKITASDIQSALCESFGFDEEEAVALINENLTGQDIVARLRDFNFEKYHPEILGEVELDDSILPPGTFKLLTEQTVKVKGEIWQVHKNDADPFPSIPHAHNYASRVSLHLGTGELFKKRKMVDQLQCKKLLAIREKLDKFELPKLDDRCK